MSKIKLQSVCLLSILVLSQMAGTVRALEVTGLNPTAASSSSKPSNSENPESKTTTFMSNYGTGDLTAGTYVGETETLKWGTSPWSFDENTGVLKIEAGTLGESSSSPWNRGDEYDIDSSAIKEIDFDGKITLPHSCISLFANLKNLAKMSNLTNLDTTNVTKMDAMFSEDSSLVDLDLSSFDTSKTDSAEIMFLDMSALKSLDLSSFNTKNILDESDMFTGTSNLQILKLGKDFNFFDGSGLGAANADKGETNGNWVREDGKSKDYNPTDFMSKYGTDDLTAGTYVAETKIWGTSPWSFDETSGILKIETGTLNDYTRSPWNRIDSYKIDPKAIKEIEFVGKVNAPTKSNNLLDGLQNLTKFNNLDNFNTSDVADMSSLFAGDSSLISLDLSHFNTSKVSTMYHMFYGTSKLENLDLSTFDTSNVTSMEGMFNGNSSLISLDLSHFNTSKVTTMYHMFNEARKIVKLDLSTFDTSNVTNMEQMFDNNSSLTSLDLSHFNTSKVTAMNSMFNGCPSLTSLDLNSFDTSKVTNMAFMFNGTHLNSLILGDKFKFSSNAALGAPIADKGTPTGKWVREDGKSNAYTPADFMSLYGTGDLTSGTYVGELKKQATLDLSATTDKSKYIIGDKIETTFLIKHAENSEDDSVAQKISLSDLSQFTLSGSQELPKNVTIETYGSNDKLTDSKEENLTANLNLADLKKGDYYKIVISGQAINNTDSEIKSNYDMKLSYSPDGTEDNIVRSIDQMIEIDSGELKFSSIPELMEFKPTPFSTDLNNTLIDREDSDWQLKISDLRGTIAHGEEKIVDRKNWNIYVTADAFKDEDGKEVPNNALATTFVKGDQQTDLSSEETQIVTHDVAGETPKDDAETIINWGNDEGIKAVVHDRSKLDTNKKYSSDMTFELRIEP